MSAYSERLHRSLLLLDEHDAETRRLHFAAMETNTFPPVGTFPAREEARRRISVSVEEAARGLLAEIGLYAVPGRAP